MGRGGEAFGGTEERGPGARGRAAAGAAGCDAPLRLREGWGVGVPLPCEGCAPHCCPGCFSASFLRPGKAEVVLPPWQGGEEGAWEM